MPHLQRADERGSPGRGGPAAGRRTPALNAGASLQTPSAAGLPVLAAAVRRHDPERFLAALFAPAAARDDLLAVYAFNLEVAKIREVVSQPLLGQIRLKWWSDALDEVYGGGPVRRHEVLGALHRAVGRHHLPRAPFDRLLDGRLLDLEDGPLPDIPSLARYAEATSGSLAELGLAVLGAVDGTAMDAGRAVGTAWALSGLLRAIPFHAAARRLYLPADRLRAHDIDPETLFAGAALPGARAVVGEVADLARQQLCLARRHRPGRRAMPVLMLARLADLHLRRLEATGYDPFAAVARPISSAAIIPRFAWSSLTGRF